MNTLVTLEVRIPGLEPGFAIYFHATALTAGQPTLRSARAVGRQLVEKGLSPVKQGDSACLSSALPTSDVCPAL